MRCLAHETDRHIHGGRRDPPCPWPSSLSSQGMQMREAWLATLCDMRRKLSSGLKAVAHDAKGSRAVGWDRDIGWDTRHLTKRPA